MTESLEAILAALRQKYDPQSPTPSPPKDFPNTSISREPLPARDSLISGISGPDQRRRSPESPHPDLQRWAAQHQEKHRHQIRAQAQQWLDQLDPLSGEGLWFADFAKHYPTPLDAAIAMVETEQQSS